MTAILKECVALVREHMAWVREQEAQGRDLRRGAARRRARIADTACRVAEMLLIRRFGDAQEGSAIRGERRCVDIVAWASELVALAHGESVAQPATLMRLRYELDGESGYLPFLMPAGTYSKGATDDLISFAPAQKDRP